MKNITTLNQGDDTATQKVGGFKYIIRTLLIATLLGHSVNGMAQDIQSQEQSSTQTEVVKEPKFSVHGMVSLGSNGIAGDAAELCSTNPTFIGMVDVSHNKSGLGFTTVRLDDGNNDPSQPASRVTILNPHLTKKFGKNNEFKVDLEGKYAMFDKMPECNGFSPDIKGAYSTQDGWTFEGMYTHKFKKGKKDSDAIRLSVSKKLDEVLQLTAQGWYETEYDNKHFYARVMADIDLGKELKGIKVQPSLTAKNGELTPTISVIYPF